MIRLRNKACDDSRLDVYDIGLLVGCVAKAGNAVFTAEQVHSWKPHEELREIKESLLRLAELGYLVQDRAEFKVNPA